MVEVVPTPAAPITGNVLFYTRPEPLNRETHARLGLRRIARPYSFAQSAHVIPLTVTEFAAAGLSYPVIFAGERRQPLGVMGINPTQNMFIRDDGAFEVGVYIPAYIRRYPFVLAADASREQLVVCIDRAAPMIGDLPDFALFDAAGEPSDYTKNCIQFCNDFEVEVRRTESFVSLMQDLDLFETKTATFTPGNPDGSPAGPPQTIAEYFAVSETKLKALPDDKVRALLDNGALPQIYAHLHSLLGWDRLISLAVARAGAAPGPANLN